MKLKVYDDSGRAIAKFKGDLKKCDKAWSKLKVKFN